jgi:hypothetical protein
MGIEPTRAALPELENKRFGAMANTKCDWRVNFRGMWGHVRIRRDTSVGEIPGSCLPLVGSDRSSPDHSNSESLAPKQTLEGARLVELNHRLAKSAGTVIGVPVATPLRPEANAKPWDIAVSSASHARRHRISCQGQALGFEINSLPSESIS